MYTKIPTIVVSTIFLAGLGQAHANYLCVDPTNVSCFSTIQEAVDNATPGDTIVVKPVSDPKGYTENVVIDTPNITLRGFGFLKPITTTTDEVCPKVILDVCETTEDPTECGRDNSGDGITVNASDVTIEQFTIRHAYKAIELNNGADNATIQNICFINFYEGVHSSYNVNNVTVAHSVFRGQGSSTVEIDGDNTMVYENHILTADNGIELDGNSVVVTKNWIRTGNDGCIEVDGDNGEITYNVLNACDEGIDYDGDNPNISNNVVNSSADENIDVNCTDSCTGGVIANNVLSSNSDDDNAIDVSNAENFLIEG